ncbi:MAG: hypothetical protein AAF614_13560 [Chloroflexota bacterium]
MDLSSNSSSQPSKITLFLTSLMLLRFGMLGRIAGLPFDERNWIYPIMAETFIAAFAPFVAHQLAYEQRLRSWLVGLLFHFSALLSASVTLLFEQTMPLASRGTNPQLLLAYAVFLLSNAASLWLLSHPQNRAYYRRE